MKQQVSPSIFHLGGHGSIFQRRWCGTVSVRCESRLVSHCQWSYCTAIQQVSELCSTNVRIVCHDLYRCRESALLLTVSMGSALLLIEDLEQDSSLVSLATLSSYDSQVSSPLPSALHEMGVHHLSRFEANQVLHHRLDLTKRWDERFDRSYFLHIYAINGDASQSIWSNSAQCLPELATANVWLIGS